MQPQRWLSMAAAFGQPAAAGMSMPVVECLLEPPCDAPIACGALELDLLAEVVAQSAGPFLKRCLRVLRCPTLHSKLGADCGGMHRVL
jgi:hypothetical protein